MKKLQFFGIVALAMVLGMTVIGCDLGSNDDPDEFILTGLDAYNNKYAMAVSRDKTINAIAGIINADPENGIANGAKISGGSATFPMVMDRVAVGFFTGDGTFTFDVSVFEGEAIQAPTPTTPPIAVGSVTMTLKGGKGKGTVTF
ncbi:hypothetical protein AGMMS49942_27370 [Spirochaetia bacterium]|nr:hypothetical protein AGMMS49942_27370 [Spirochaetia bacterium]